MPDKLAISLAFGAARGSVDQAQRLEERLRQAFLVARRNDMFDDEQAVLYGGCAAVLEHASEEERERVRFELRVAQKLTAVVQANDAGIPLSLSDAFADVELDERPEPVGVLAIWRSVYAPRCWERAPDGLAASCDLERGHSGDHSARGVHWAGEPA